MKYPRRIFKNYHQILLKMREERNRELKQYEDWLSQSFSFKDEYENLTAEISIKRSKEKFAMKDDAYFVITPVRSINDILNKRRSILTLELPFKTDTMSLNCALVGSYDDPPTSYRTIDEWVYHAFPAQKKSEDEYDSNMQRKHYLQLLTSDKVWPLIKKIHSDEHGVKSGSRERADLEDFVMDSVRDTYFNTVSSLPGKPSSLKVRSSHARQMIQYRRHENIGSKNSLQFTGINANVLAKYFEYLENRCLRQTTEEAYKTLIGVRLLFYAPPSPLHLKQLQQITRSNIDRENSIINFGESSFPVPSTFIEIVETLFSKDESLLQKNTKQTNDFIRRTAEAIGLQKLNTTTLRKSLPFICHQERLVIKKLPRR